MIVNETPTEKLCNFLVDKYESYGFKGIIIHENKRLQCNIVINEYRDSLLINHKEIQLTGLNASDIIGFKHTDRFGLEIIVGKNNRVVADTCRFDGRITIELQTEGEADVASAFPQILIDNKTNAIFRFINIDSD